MQRYTIFAVGGPEKASDNLEAKASDDIEAVNKADELFPGYAAIEVWCGTRLIARLDRDLQAP